ncbi:MAG: flagellar basal body P-ring formation protein FlgA [Pirellulales bacterium]|nr:flagellar basal body P-ring formation protein FlgA [Pirellulales bacterium]
MRTTTIIAAAIVAILTLVSAGPGSASEIVLRDTYQCRGTIVTLGDVAEVLGSDQRSNEQLSRVELFPAPSEGRQRYVRVREIQDILARRGENLAKHRFSGANQIAITRTEQVEQVDYEKPINASIRNSINLRVENAILEYLRSGVSDSKWTIELNLSPEQIRQLQGAVRRLTVSGGGAPWVGSQQFLVTAQKNNGKPVQLRIEARIGLPPSVVVANRPIPRNAIINAADLTLDSQVPRNSAMETFSSIEEVAGSQAVQNIAAGAIIDQKNVRAPLMVRRSEIVSVTARAAGVKVSTNCRARSDGSMGDVIQVESLHDRKSFYARVCGSRQAEVYSPTVRARQTTPTNNYERPASGSGGPSRIPLEQPRSVRNNKLQYTRKGNW